MDTLATVISWLQHLECARSQHVIDFPGGVALLHDDFPDAHDHNRVSVHCECDPAELIAVTDRVLLGAGRQHLEIDVLSAPLADSLGPALLAAGYSCNNGLLMHWTETTGAPRATRDVVHLDLAERSAAAELSWREAEPDEGPGVWHQLGQRIAATAAVVDTIFLAVRHADGGVAARADVYLGHGIAQVEQVLTAEPHRGRGYAAQLVTAAVEQARAAGAQTVFLLADADDWPKELYRRLGFTDLGRTANFDRSPTPLP